MRGKPRPDVCVPGELSMGKVPMLPLLVGEKRKKKEILQKKLDFKTKDADDEGSSTSVLVKAPLGFLQTDLHTLH